MDSIKTSESGGRAHPGGGDALAADRGRRGFRAEGKQHKDDELHHFYELMHTINEQQTQRTPDQIALQEQSFFSTDTVTSRRKKVVATPQCGDKSAFFHEGTRSIFASGPTDTC